MARKSWVQINGKLVPKEEADYVASQTKLEIMGDIEPFVSPITGEVIKGRNHLRRHMKEHGVTHASDYSKEWYDKKAKERQAQFAGQTRRDRMERIELLKRAIDGE